jgi:hypothetical protein
MHWSVVVNLQVDSQLFHLAFHAVLITAGLLIWGIDAVTDQRIAGLIMKLGGGLLLWSVIAYMFFKWNAREEAQRSEEVTWEDFERELEVWDMRK